MRPEWETAYLAAILCLNTTTRGCELKGLHWSDVDLFSKTLTIRKSKTTAGERVIPLTDVAASALARLRRRAEGFGTVEPSHYVFATFVPKFKFSGKKAIDYKLTGFDPTRHLKSWGSAWRTLTKRGCRVSGSMICGIAPSLSFPRTARPTPPSWQLRDTSVVACWNDIATCEWKRSETRWKPLLQAGLNPKSETVGKDTLCRKGTASGKETVLGSLSASSKIGRAS